MLFVDQNIYYPFLNSWTGELKLDFECQGGRSILTRCERTGPFLIQKILYPDLDKIVPHVYLLYPPGGLIGGDKLLLNVYLKSNVHVLFTTPGSSKFYRTNGLYAVQKNIFELGENAILEWVPQSTIFYPKTKAMINTNLILHQDSRIIFFDMLCVSNLVLNECFGPEEINSFININVPFSVGLQERLRLNAFDYLMKLGGFKIIASFIAMPSNKKILYQVNRFIKSITNDMFLGGATLLDNLLVVRLLGNDNQNLRKILYSIWNITRPFVIQRRISIPYMLLI